MMVRTADRFADLDNADRRWRMNRIQRIKAVRDERGCSLGEAQAIVNIEMPRPVPARDEKQELIAGELVNALSHVTDAELALFPSSAGGQHVGRHHSLRSSVNHAIAALERARELIGWKDGRWT